MKLQSYIIITVAALFTLCKPVFSQVKTKIFKNGIPSERINPIIKTKEIVFDEPEDIEKIKSEIENSELATCSNKFAHSIKVDLDFIEKAEVTKFKQSVYFSLTIKATNALN